jgi:hypothetical protein
LVFECIVSVPSQNPNYKGIGMRSFSFYCE